VPKETDIVLNGVILTIAIVVEISIKLAKAPPWTVACIFPWFFGKENLNAALERSF
jgi:hypothetical protein